MTALLRANEELRLTQIHRLIGLDAEQVGDGRARVRLPLGENVASAHAPLHGGMISLLADVTSAMTMDGAYDKGVEVPVSVDLHVRFYRQPRSGPVTADATIVHRGSKIVGTECVVRDAEGRQIARTSATYMIVQGFGDLSGYQEPPSSSQPG